MLGCLPTKALAFLAVSVYETQAIAFEWKPGFSVNILRRCLSETNTTTRGL